MTLIAVAVEISSQHAAVNGRLREQSRRWLPQCNALIASIHSHEEGSRDTSFRLYAFIGYCRISAIRREHQLRSPTTQDHHPFGLVDIAFVGQLALILIVARSCILRSMNYSLQIQPLSGQTRNDG